MRRLRRELIGRFRDELLNETLFSSPDDARRQIQAWLEADNHHRPPPGLGIIRPAEFVAKKGTAIRVA